MKLLFPLPPRVGETASAAIGSGGMEQRTVVQWFAGGTISSCAADWGKTSSTR